MRLRHGLVLAVLFALGPSAEARGTKTKAAITLAYAQGLTPSYTGRVFVFFSRRPGEPRFGPNWFSPEPVFAMDVVDWKPGEPLAFDPPLSYPRKLSTLEPSRYNVQALMRLNPHARQLGRGAGNAYSAVREVLVRKTGELSVALHINKVVPPRQFREGILGKAKEVAIRSELLSAFHGRDVMVRAAVTVPLTYERDPRRRYPALFIIPGFTTRHYDHSRYTKDSGAGHAEDIVRIVLDPSCGGGHHVFADSANNGPWGRALIEELIPAIEARYRLVPAPTARFLTGGSSGGWASLWLQITYPDCFNGTWSFCPDPVDFRDFQQIDLYRPGANLYRDGKGQRWPVGRHEGKVLLYFDDFIAMETVLGDGGQIRSFEWCFSPRGKDGKPMDLFDRKTGKVDARVAKAWEAYDIRLVLERKWKALAPRLKGKLNVFVGGKDNFYLDGATRLLAQTMKALGSDAVIVIDEDRNHQSIHAPKLEQRRDRELMRRFRAAHPRGGR